eukprot:62691-Pyramimonas_sp.AAC.1
MPENFCTFADCDHRAREHTAVDRAHGSVAAPPGPQQPTLGSPGGHKRLGQAVSSGSSSSGFPSRISSGL